MGVLVARWALILKTDDSDDALVDRAAAYLHARGIRAGGFRQRSWDNALGTSDYEILRVGTPGTVPLGRTGAQPVNPVDSYCSFAFDGRAWRQAWSWLEEDVGSGARVLFVDKVGKMEAAGQGHLDALTWVLKVPGVVVVACVKEGHLFNVVERLGLVEDPVASLEAASEEPAFLAALAASVEAEGRGEEPARRG